MTDGILGLLPGRRGRVPRWLLSLLLSALGYLAAEYVMQQATFGHARALERATELMVATCRSECGPRGLRPEDLDGPYEAPVNHQAGARYFEFLWKSKGADDLLVVISNNRLFVDTQHWWERQDWWYKPGQAPR